MNRPAVNREIEGYASKTSINVGEQIDFYVSTNAPFYNLDIYRMGWYQGMGARLVTAEKKLKGLLQPMPKSQVENGLLECDWRKSYTLLTHVTWCTGIYVAKLTESVTQKQSYILFVVRNDAKVSDVVFQLPVTTYQAYNYWGGKSLYDWGSGDAEQWGGFPGKRAFKVSFDRPYARSNNRAAAYGMGAGEFFCNVQPNSKSTYPISSAGWDYNMVRWLEKQGYDVGYITNIDTHQNNRAVVETSIFISHGHDEYWSFQMRENVRKRIGQGGNVAFFSGNTMYWQVRLEDSELSGSPLRTMVCYKDRSLDPIKTGRCTVKFREHPLNNPEAKLMGVQHVLDPVDTDYVVTNESHWVFDGTSLEYGDKLVGLLGYEVDAISEASPPNTVVLCSSPVKSLIPDNFGVFLQRKGQYWTRKGIQFFVKSGFSVTWGRRATIFLGLGILASICCLCYYLWLSKMILMVLLMVLGISFALGILLLEWRGRGGDAKDETTSDMTLYEDVNGAMVFSSGGIQWSWGLDDFNVPLLRSSRKNTNAEQITANIIKRFIGNEVGKPRR
ncbi:N,N-dimethylformamidase beta subunit family domain-containing protein [Maribacter sp. 2-571]|uniref:N,N-dimethylformamidase beta subunit family domain-containing protein n=1 Tax=Maribacter sp. 2-571 TaxID=3417569 RepID=UPI003D332A94